ncbi:hypothetical protein KIN20_014159 [Parelaphostrongylus tenuis]|uniref:Uncharacterized protein n=1 Tax=Parelaphostrongylus tenuis TaxID=148309 RepID=A0AAD5MWZ6_PARTN|nr:hypothetical protein KIN20_014159 [Parelaphostrongylus tenuis]
MTPLVQWIAHTLESANQYMAGLASDSIMISLLATVSTVLGCGCDACRPSANKDVHSYGLHNFAGFHGLY